MARRERPAGLFRAPNGNGAPLGQGRTARLGCAARLGHLGCLGRSRDIFIAKLSYA